MITANRITRPQAAVAMLAQNRIQMRALFLPDTAPGTAVWNAAFPRSRTFRWLLDRRIGLSVMVGTWLIGKIGRAIGT
jgi:hypothetical protein